MSENLKIWDKLGKTDPAHTKKFKRSGGFEGTAIKPMFSYHRMTEEFGPCGTGWGIGKPDFQVVSGENKEVLVYCTVSIWYDSKENTVFGVGGDKVVTHIKANEQYKRPERWESDDEAFKKAFTDAVTNALKLIGVGADVHMGMFDDNKYVNAMTAHFSEPQDDRTDNWTPEQRSLQAEVITKLSHCADNTELDSVLDEYALKLETLPATMMDVVNDQINNTRDMIKKGIKPKESAHKFVSVKDAGDWGKRALTAIGSIKSIPVLDQWEKDNRPFILGVGETLKADKYVVDGTTPKDRICTALMNKRAELTTINNANTPIG